MSSFADGVPKAAASPQSLGTERLSAEWKRYVIYERRHIVMIRMISLMSVFLPGVGGA